MSECGRSSKKRMACPLRGVIRPGQHPDVAFEVLRPISYTFVDKRPNHATTNTTSARPIESHVMPPENVIIGFDHVVLSVTASWRLLETTIHRGGLPQYGRTFPPAMKPIWLGAGFGRSSPSWNHQGECVAVVVAMVGITGDLTETGGPNLEVQALVQDEPCPSPDP